MFEVVDELSKIYVFVDGSFTNNKDLSSQIKYIVILGIKTKENTEFTLSNDIIYINFTKYKRITPLILASELYIIIVGIDILISLAIIIDMIINKLGFPWLPIIVCTDSLCIVKLGTTKERHLIINIMVIC
jgi:hypothetical protein